MGRRAKTINNYFCEAETAQSNEPAESSLAQTIGGDYATVEGRQSQQSNEKCAQGYALSTFRLCDLTGHVELKTVCLTGTGSEAARER